MGSHWWANYELGVADAVTSTAYNLAVFAFAVSIITGMII